MDFEILAKGGIVMAILGILSIYGLAIIFFKAYQFFTSNVFDTHYVDGAMQPINAGELTRAQQLLANQRGPVARIMRTAIACVMDRNMSMKSRESEISRVGSAEIRYMESHLRGLEMIATTAPLLGLLGTVIGMIKAFAKLGEAGARVDPSMLAGGIWEALLTTVGGLTVAIPALAMYYLIDAIIEKTRSHMHDVTVQILALEDRYLKNEEEQKLATMDAKQRELWEREESLKRTIEEQEKAVSTARSTPQTTGTLKLLNPKY